MKPLRYLLPCVLFIGGLWLMYGVSWRAALGVFLFTWGNNLVYSMRIKELLLRSAEETLKSAAQLRTPWGDPRR